MRKGFAMHEGQPPVRFVTLRISATIANEYANRCPEWLSEELDEGRFLNYLKLRDEVAAAADKLASRLADKANAKVQNKALNRRPTDKYGKR